jgi:hypothetical protein
MRGRYSAEFVGGSGRGAGCGKEFETSRFGSFSRILCSDLVLDGTSLYRAGEEKFSRGKSDSTNSKFIVWYLDVGQRVQAILVKTKRKNLDS